MIRGQVNKDKAIHAGIVVCLKWLGGVSLDALGSFFAEKKSFQLILLYLFHISGPTALKLLVSLCEWLMTSLKVLRLFPSCTKHHHSHDAVYWVPLKPNIFPQLSYLLLYWLYGLQHVYQPELIMYHFLLLQQG